MMKDVIMPALGMAQETGKVLQWFKTEGDSVSEGEPLLEVETDKVTVEIEAPASGILANVTASAGAEVPVGQAIAEILAPGEERQGDKVTGGQGDGGTRRQEERGAEKGHLVSPSPPLPLSHAQVEATPVARRIAAEHSVDLRRVKPAGGRIGKAEVLAYLETVSAPASADGGPRLQPASPKARRLAAERDVDIAAIEGSGPDGAVLAADVLAAATRAPAPEPEAVTLSTAWRVMAERVTRSWTSVPHFYLLREVNASRLITWREKSQSRFAEKITYTDLLVKVVAAVLRQHPRLNARWDADQGTIVSNPEVNVGLAVATEEGLIVPVIHQADKLRLNEIAARRTELVTRAEAGELRPADIAGGTFTLSNLGMYGVDAFNAIVNPPQAAILAVGRIAERVVPVNGEPAVQPMMMLSLSCDHRVIDGARAAQFLDTLAGLIEEPLGLLD